MMKPATVLTLEDRLTVLRDTLDLLTRQEKDIQAHKRQVLEDILGTRRRIHRMNQGTE